MVFNNTGVVDAESGVLSFNAGDTGNSSGSFSAQSGATVQFDGGTFTLTGSVAPGSGTLAVAAGTVNFEGTYNDDAANTSISGSGTLAVMGTLSVEGDFNQSGGTVTGPGTLGVTGQTTWTGGTMSGTGTTDAQGGLAIGQSADYYGTPSVTLDTRTLTNEGTATFSGQDEVYGYPFQLYVYDGATINNLAGAAWDVQDNNSIDQGNGATGTFDNAGCLKRRREPEPRRSVWFSTTREWLTPRAGY